MKPIVTPIRQIWILIITLIVLSLIAACSANQGSEGDPTIENNWVTISGQIMPADETSEPFLPASNRITVQVKDTNRADAPAIILAQQIISDAKSLPNPYQIEVNKTDLENTVQASLSVRIEDAQGKLWYINDTVHPVSANQTTVDIAVIAVEKSSETQSLPPAFDGQVWQWIAFQDSADGEESNDIIVGDPASYTLELLPYGTYAVKADCNIVSGQISLQDSSLSLAPGAMTLAACEPESQSVRYIELLGDVVTFVFDSEGNLVLNLKMDAGNMIFMRQEQDE